MVDLEACNIEIAGVRCGGRSKLNVNRGQNKDVTIPCSTTDDLMLLFQKLTSPVGCTNLLLLENVEEFENKVGREEGGFSDDFMEYIQPQGNPS